MFVPSVTMLTSICQSPKFYSLHCKVQINLMQFTVRCYLYVFCVNNIQMATHIKDKNGILLYKLALINWWCISRFTQKWCTISCKRSFPSKILIWLHDKNLWFHCFLIVMSIYVLYCEHNKLSQALPCLISSGFSSSSKSNICTQWLTVSHHYIFMETS